ncbi:MAG: malto-oligosyltrehalose synthase [Acidobacteriota bacterium]
MVRRHGGESVLLRAQNQHPFGGRPLCSGLGQMYRVPRATYRLQLNAGFTFADVKSVAPYLAELGISDIYSSPILKARKGSTHGYDIVDPAVLNPELGTEADFATLHQALARQQIGLLLDVVPNHMAASHENAWWMSVLENGPKSRFVHYFDIDWRCDRILLPILGRPYGEALESREIRLRFDEEGFWIAYYDKRLPLAPDSYRLVLRECAPLPDELRELVEVDAEVANSKFLKETLWRICEEDPNFRATLDATVEGISIDALDALLDAQWYRLAYWRIASETINYRRFFDVTDLVGVRVENPEVFEARNRRIFELIAEGKVTGLRIDHIDGLHDPVTHMRKLQARLADGFYVIVEKILAHDEELPAEFPVSGTTGYEFANALNALFVDSAGLQRLDAFYRAFTGETRSFADICYEKKKQVIQELFSGEMRALGEQLADVAMSDRNARDFAPVDLTAALTEVIACLNVYRTYVRDEAVSDADARRIREAIACARARAALSVDRRLFIFLENVLLVRPPAYVKDRDRWLAFVTRWQQFTARVMAKGVEDTAFYTYNRLVSLNEVGGEPGREAFDGAADLHRHNARRAAAWPHTLNATSTHDTKRSEDVRARIDVLSEMPDVWARQVRRWSRMNAALRRDGIPHPNEELLLYQTLMGMWPLDDADLPSVRPRLKLYLEKAAREAKSHTSWIAPNAEYEEALLGFADALLSHDDFCRELVRFQKRVAFFGAINALAQLVVKATSPGVPDFYQGTELWDFSLVDPDNRRPIDYARRAAMLRKIKSANVDTLLRRWPDGRVKLFTTWKLLDVRARHADLFRDGDYEPLEVTPNVFAFVRRNAGGAVAVAVPRLASQLVKPGKFPLGEVWGDTTLPLPGRWRNAFTGGVVEGESLLLREVFARFPVAVLEKA